jgi:hypothetical protein
MLTRERKVRGLFRHLPLCVLTLVCASCATSLTGGAPTPTATVEPPGVSILGLANESGGAPMAVQRLIVGGDGRATAFIRVVSSAESLRSPRFTSLVDYQEVSSSVRRLPGHWYQVLLGPVTSRARLVDIVVQSGHAEDGSDPLNPQIYVVGGLLTYGAHLPAKVGPRCNRVVARGSHRKSLAGPVINSSATDATVITPEVPSENPLYVHVLGQRAESGVVIVLDSHGQVRIGDSQCISIRFIRHNAFSASVTARPDDVLIALWFPSMEPPLGQLVVPDVLAMIPSPTVTVVR